MSLITHLLDKLYNFMNPGPKIDELPNLHAYEYMVANNIDRYSRAIARYNTIQDDKNNHFLEVVFFYLWVFECDKEKPAKVMVSKKNEGAYAELYTLFLCGFIEIIEDSCDKALIEVKPALRGLLRTRYFRKRMPLIRAQLERLRETIT